MSTLIVYTKANCPLCSTLIGKIEQLQPSLGFDLELRDITTQPEWWERHQYTIPDIVINDRPVPRPAPGISVDRLGKLLAMALAQG